MKPAKKSEPLIDGGALYYGEAPKARELKPDRAAIRAEQKRNHERKTVRVRSKLP